MPFFLYYAPGACHAPKEWIERFKGRFDAGYEAIREQTLAEQKQLGIVPQDTELPPINPIGTPGTRTGPEGRPFPELDYTRPWDSLNDDEKRLFCRMAEVYAGFLGHADFRLGRLLDSLEDAGELENTMIVVVSDNGASGEGGPNGSVNEMKFANGVPDDLDQNLAMIDELGGTRTYNHNPTGWAMAFDTPLKMWKRYEFNGRTCDPCIVSWPAGVKARGEIRHQYHPAIDLVPTVLDVLGIEPPATIKGHTQTPYDGVGMRGSFDAFGTLTLFHGDRKVGESRIRTQLGAYAIAGAPLFVGRHGGEPVTVRRAPRRLPSAWARSRCCSAPSDSHRGRPEA